MKGKYLRLKREKSHKKVKDKDKEKGKNIKQVDYGLALLKLYLAFLVVINHNFNRKTTKNKIILYLTIVRPIHVSCFFIMSFYFLCNTLTSLNIKLIAKRFTKLLIP